MIESDSGYQKVYKYIQAGPRDDNYYTFATASSLVITNIASQLAANISYGHVNRIFPVLADMDAAHNREMQKFYLGNGHVNQDLAEEMSQEISTLPKKFNLKYLTNIIEESSITIPDRESPLEVIQQLHPFAYFAIAAQFFPHEDFISLMNLETFTQNIRKLTDNPNDKYDDRMLDFIRTSWEVNKDNIRYSNNPTRLKVAKLALLTANKSWQTSKLHQVNLQLSQGKSVAETKLVDLQLTYFDDMPRRVKTFYDHHALCKVIPSLGNNMVVYKLLQDAHQYAD